MFNVNLKRELEAIAEHTVSETDLLKEDSLMVEDQWTSTWFAKHETDTCLTQEGQRRKRKQYLQEAYSEKHIRTLCIQYRLRCLPVNLFKGVMDSQVPDKKLSFEREFTQTLEEPVEKSNYRIVAPSELFKVAHGNLDPLLLYKFTYQGITYYKLVHQWGGELNGYRSLINYPLRSLKHLSVCTLLVWMPIILTLCFNLPGLSMPWAYILSAFLLTGTLLFTHSLFTNRHGQSQTSDRIWDSQPVI